MKVIFENGDEVFYEGERCVIKGDTKQVNGVDGVHILKPNGDLVLTPVTVLQTHDQWLLNECIEVLNGYAQWEANLTMDENDDLLESMSTENYEMMLRLQSERNEIAKVLVQRNKGKN